MTEKAELDPMCLKGTIAAAVTNRGELIPCCRCDDPHTIKDSEFAKLLSVSKISDYDSIEEIAQTKEWKDFENNLRNNIAPPACWWTCIKNKEEKYYQTLTIINPENQEQKHIERR